MLKPKLLTTLALGIALLLPVTDVEASSNVKDVISVHVKFPDSISSSGGTEPTNVNTIMDMVRNPGKYPQRSGWSATIYRCNADGTGWNVYEDMRYSTLENTASYSVSDVRSAITGKYGTEVYNLAEKHGMKLMYDSSTPIPDKYLPPKQGLGNTGKYVIHHQNTATGNSCTPDAYGYSYTNYDFYVAGTVEIPWEEPTVKPGGMTGEIYWELDREDSRTASDVSVQSSLKPNTDAHVAVKDVVTRVGIGSNYKENTEGGVITIKDKSKYLKNAPINYSINYNYTNKKVGYVCSGEGDAHKCVYDDSPDWRAEQNFQLGSVLVPDFELGKTIRVSDINKLGELKFKVGEKVTWAGHTSQSKYYFESIKKHANNIQQPKYNLHTQTHMPMSPGDYVYSIELPSGKHTQSNFKGYNKEGSHGYFYAVELDESLKKDYKFK